MPIDIENELKSEHLTSYPDQIRLTNQHQIKSNKKTPKLNSKRIKINTDEDSNMSQLA